MEPMFFTDDSSDGIFTWSCRSLLSSVLKMPKKHKILIWQNNFIIHTGKEKDKLVLYQVGKRKEPMFFADDSSDGIFTWS